MKKTLAALFIFLFLLNFSASALLIEDIPVDITINENFIKADVYPFIANGSTYVPIRFVSEALNVDSIRWDGKSSTVTIQGAKTEIILTIGKNFAYVNQKRVPVENTIVIREDRTFVPVRFISEIFGCTVTWDSQFFIVGINKPGITTAKNLIAQTTSTEDILWLAKIIHSESDGESLMGKIAVGNVILNRVESSLYPNTIYDVIFDNKHGVQFQPTSNGTIHNKPSSDSIKAAKYALRGVNVVGESMFFLNPRISTSFWIVENRAFYTSVGNHDFYV